MVRTTHCGSFAPGVGADGREKQHSCGNRSPQMGKPPPNFAMPQHSSAITADIQTRLKLKASSSILVWPAAKSSDLCSVWRMMPITFSFALGQYVVESSTAIARTHDYRGKRNAQSNIGLGNPDETRIRRKLRTCCKSRRSIGYRPLHHDELCKAQLLTSPAIHVLAGLLAGRFPPTCGRGSWACHRG